MLLNRSGLTGMLPKLPEMTANLKETSSKVLIDAKKTLLLSKRRHKKYAPEEEEL